MQTFNRILGLAILVGPLAFMVALAIARAA